MKTNSITCQWTQGMSFQAEVNTHQITLDADAQFEGQDQGPRPKPLLLVSLAGCTGMDVVALLKKMRVAYQALSIQVTGELTEEHPKIYHKIQIEYLFQGEDLPMDKLEKAVNLSQNQYCGVSAMLRQAAEISYEIKINA